MDLKDELSKAATEAIGKITDEVKVSIENLKVAGKDIQEKATQVSKNLALAIKQKYSGELDPEMADEVIRRELKALEALAASVKEVAAHEAIVRAKSALKIAGEVGIKLAQVALTVI